MKKKDALTGQDGSPGRVSEADTGELMEIIIERDKCVGCGVCIDLCPADEPVLELVDNVAVAMHLEHCQECQACAVNCEYGAVSYIE